MGDKLTRKGRQPLIISSSTNVPNVVESKVQSKTTTDKVDANLDVSDDNNEQFVVQMSGNGAASKKTAKSTITKKTGSKNEKIRAASTKISSGKRAKEVTSSEKNEDKEFSPDKSSATEDRETQKKTAKRGRVQNKAKDVVISEKIRNEIRVVEKVEHIAQFFICHFYVDDSTGAAEDYDADLTATNQSGSKEVKRSVITDAETTATLGNGNNDEKTTVKRVRRGTKVAASIEEEITLDEVLGPRNGVAAKRSRKVANEMDGSEKKKKNEENKDVSPDEDLCIKDAPVKRGRKGKKEVVVSEKDEDETSKDVSPDGDLSIKDAPVKRGRRGKKEVAVSVSEKDEDETSKDVSPDGDLPTKNVPVKRGRKGKKEVAVSEKDEEETRKDVFLDGDLPIKNAPVKRGRKGKKEVAVSNEKDEDDTRKEVSPVGDSDQDDNDFTNNGEAVSKKPVKRGRKGTSSQDAPTAKKSKTVSMASTEKGRKLTGK